MDDIAIVSTSINAKPSAYSEWATAGKLIVAGDLNTPDGLEWYVRSRDGIYIAPDVQESKYLWSKHIGWKNIQRRNAAIWEAYIMGFQYVLTVDDDNHPAVSAHQFVAGHIDAMMHKVESTVGSATDFLNTGIFTVPQFHQRGVPYGVYANATTIRSNTIESAPNIVVSQAQVLGDPDCDAVERIANAPMIVAVNANIVITPGTYAAFNSQATMWKHAWVPVMAVLPGIGRYDDIFASYIFARLAREYNVTVHVGDPCVTQLRNEHNLAADLRAELWGMQNVFAFCAALDRAHISSDMPLWMAYSELISACEGVLPVSTMKFAHEWVRSWREVAA